MELLHTSSMRDELLKIAKNRFERELPGLEQGAVRDALQRSGQGRVLPSALER